MNARGEGVSSRVELSELVEDGGGSLRRGRKSLSVHCNHKLTYCGRNSSELSNTIVGSPMMFSCDILGLGNGGWRQKWRLRQEGAQCVF